MSRLALDDHDIENLDSDGWIAIRRLREQFEWEEEQRAIDEAEAADAESSDYDKIPL